MLDLFDTDLSPCCGEAGGVIGSFCKTSQGATPPEGNTRVCLLLSWAWWFSWACLCPLALALFGSSRSTLGGRYHRIYLALDSATPCGDQLLGSRLLSLLPPCQDSLHWFAMMWAMAPVKSTGFRLWELGGEGVSNLRRVRRVLVSQVSTAGILSGVRDVLIAANYMPFQCCQGLRQSTGSSRGILVIIRSAPYLGLRRSFGGKPQLIHFIGMINLYR